MSNREIVRAWKDPEFRATLGNAMPDHPAGQIQFAYPGLERNAGMESLNISGAGGCFSAGCTHSTTHGQCC